MTDPKSTRLREILASAGSGVLAFSGGVDSTFLAAVAVETLGRSVLLVTAVSPTYSKLEHDLARSTATSLGADILMIYTDECSSDTFLANPPDRCYLCKKELFGRIEAIRKERGLAVIFDGANADDSSDYRPGERAGHEYHVVSPLRDAELSKREIRELSRQMGLPTWDHPQRACLASRFPYNSPFDAAKLARIDDCEQYVYSLGFSLVRIRDHNGIARIEVPASEIEKLSQTKTRKAVAARLHAHGFDYVTIDSDGYRQGSMNETLPAEIIDGKK